MAVAKRVAQPPLDFRTPEEVEREVEATSDRLGEERTALINACKRIARELTYDHCASELERLWGRHGLHVTSATLRACCEGVDRNYFRIEWAEWFAGHSEIVAAILRTWGRMPTKTIEQEHADLKLTIAEEFPKQAQKLFEKAAKR